MFTILTFDNQVNQSDYAMPQRIELDFMRTVESYAREHGDYIEICTGYLGDDPDGDELTTYRVSFIASKPLDLVALADIARDYRQAAIGVLQGSTLVGPGSSDYPTTVKPSA